MSLSAQYVTAAGNQDGVPIYVLRDTSRKVEVRVVPSLGHNAYSMKINGREIFWTPSEKLSDAVAKPALMGNPFLAPWANRIDGMSFWANGKERKLNGATGNLRLDQNGLPIHGLVLYTDRWKVAGATASASAATLRSRLELNNVPEWMGQFPFPHAIDMTYRLSQGELEIVTEIENLGSEPMPVAIGYHPYYRLEGGRDAWTVRIPAREHVELSSKLVPTGKRTPVEKPDLPLKGNRLDDVYANLNRNAKGEAEFAMTNGQQTLTFAFGPKYAVGVVYAPPGRDFVCFEPMAAITDAFNQNHKGLYPELQTIPVGGKWKESWFIRSSGF
jgi:aldose 1-epimerase